MKNAIFCLGVLVVSMIGAVTAEAGYLTPTSVALTGDIVSAGNVNALISDASDASYVQANPGAESVGALWDAETVSDMVGVGFGDPTVHAGVYLTFDLGQAYNVSAIHAWRYIRSGTDSNGVPYAYRSVNNYALLGSADGTTYNLISNVDGDAKFTYGSDATESVQTRLLANMPDANLANAQGVRYLRMDIGSAWQGWLGDAGSHFIGLGEVAFEGTVVPEPGALTTLLLGAFGLLAYAWRKRK